MPKTYAEMRQQFDQEIIRTILTHPQLRYADIATMFGISYWAVNAIVKRHGLTGKLGRKTGPKAKAQAREKQG
jgi:hypothetical protein